MPNPLLELQSFGQSVWLDPLDRDMLQSGELARLIAEDGLGGITTNPKILHDAISQGDVYRREIEKMRRAGASSRSIYETLAIEDVQSAADLLATDEDASSTQASPSFPSSEVPACSSDPTTSAVAPRSRRYARRVFRDAPTSAAIMSQKRSTRARSSGLTSSPAPRPGSYAPDIPGRSGEVP